MASAVSRVGNILENRVVLGFCFCLVPMRSGDLMNNNYILYVHAVNPRHTQSHAIESRFDSLKHYT